MMHFYKSLELIVPTHHNDGKGLSPVENARIQTKIDAFTRRVGGVTWYDTNGRWHDSHGTIFDDRHQTYVWYIEGTEDMDTRNELLHLLDALLRTVLKEAKQDSITLKMNNNIYIVDSVDKKLMMYFDNFVRN